MGANGSKMLTLEKEIGQLQTCIQDPTLANQSSKLQQVCQELDLKQQALDQLYHRWQELEIKQKNF